jgi:cobalt-zinc-cadmium efflux system membrane fusion protein
MGLTLVAPGFMLWISPDLRDVAGALLRAADREPGKASHSHDAHDRHEHGHDGTITLTAEQIARAGIETAVADKGVVVRRLTVPGTIVPDRERIGRVAAKVIATVAELHKRLGDPVTKGEVVAVLESREVADAKSEYLAARVNFDLQKSLFDRAQMLWDGKIIPEQQFLRSQTIFTESRIRLDTARQKLSALDVSESELQDLPSQPVGALRYKEIRAPRSGRIVERRVDLGAPVGGEGHEQELYVIADLSSVWVELSVPTAALASITEGQPVSIGAAGEARGDGQIVFVSPILHPETRAARVIASIANAGMTWRPGMFVSADITVEQQHVDLCVRRSALQTMGGEQVVFVRTEAGFERREVVIGRADETCAEVVFGLDPGERVAVTNTFILKAELGKSEADHGHAH